MPASRWRFQFDLSHSHRHSSQALGQAMKVVRFELVQEALQECRRL